MNDYIVYIHISPSNKRYIGITSQEPKKRWLNGHGYKRNKHFYSAIEKYGWDNFKHIIVARGLTEDEAKWLEIELIREWDSSNREYGYNVSLGGESSNGYKHTEETKQKLSEINKGKNSYWYGKEFSDEHKENLSKSHSGSNHSNYGKHLSEKTKKKIKESNKGKIRSKETRQKISEYRKSENNSWRGKKHTEETKQKMSKSASGKNNSQATAVICITTNMVFDTATEGANYYNCSQHIGDCCRGKCKSCGKLPDGTPLIWRYLTIIEL